MSSSVDPSQTRTAFLEIACFNVESARKAVQGGADRIELCTDRSTGGNTPSMDDFMKVKFEIGLPNRIPIHVMLRPEGDNLDYLKVPTEEDMMRFGKAAASGFVFGILNRNKTVDRGNCKRLVELATGFPCTFHRAFDEISANDMEGQLEVLIECGFKSLLTSGGKGDAVEKEEVISKLIKWAAGRIEIIIGGGVRSGNLEKLKSRTGAKWYHSSAILDGEVASYEEVEALRSILDGNEGIPEVTAFHGTVP